MSEQTIEQQTLFRETVIVGGVRRYLPLITCSENRKGVLDVDTVKGCSIGLQRYPDGGCYGECYALKTAKTYGIDFSISVTRRMTAKRFPIVLRAVWDFPACWYRIGTAGDPCHDWDNTVEVCERLKYTGKIPVIITKHWIDLKDHHITALAKIGAVVNSSTSGLDTDDEIEHRVNQIERLRSAGVKSVCRVVTCEFGKTPYGSCCNAKQNLLLSRRPVIDNPLRTRKNSRLVTEGHVLIQRIKEAIGGGKTISLHCKSVHLGGCQECPDQCGVEQRSLAIAGQTRGYQMQEQQAELFAHKVEYVYVKSVIGSGFEKQVAELAIKDGIAQRAARKNMQIHSAIILKINGEFAGFFTFQVNDECGEFCLLQSVIEPSHYTPELYRNMVLAVINQNTKAYPALITTDPKSTFETPQLFESVGFVTYLKMSGFCYMVHGKLSDIRMKILAHITMTNVWNSIKGDWLRLKREWNAKIEAAGERHGVPNALFASREGCWQGEAGFSNVVNIRRTIGDDGEIKETTKSHNGNASVLDPVACEVIARFFMPKAGKRVYNPFGGGVQFGFVSGGCGYEYVASEIRRNQCDANNKLCSEFESVRWVKSDSSTYHPDGMFDLVFTCPPYYKVEKYLDYDGNPPPGEINSLDTYEKFRDVLFAGYDVAIQHLKDNRFFVVMTGDSRDKKGGYYCSESETELFFKSRGLAVYNKIVYLECEFTRLAQAKKTLNMRKFPKREQKIIVAYKGDISAIKQEFSPVGRL
jgi:hypothetical protein